MTEHARLGLEPRRRRGPGHWGPGCSAGDAAHRTRRRPAGQPVDRAAPCRCGARRKDSRRRQVRAALELLARRADPLLASVRTWLGIHPASSVVQTLDLAGLPAADAERRLGELARDLGEGMVGGWEIRQKAGRVRALLVAAPRVEVVKAAELAEAAGFRVGGMELLPVALVRAVARDGQPAGFAVYGLGQGGGRSAVAWRAGTPVLGGRLWPPAAGDAGLSVYAVPPADLDLLARSGRRLRVGVDGLPRRCRARCRSRAGFGTAAGNAGRRPTPWS